jgi:hypothetical protein
LRNTISAGLNDYGRAFGNGLRGSFSSRIAV